MVSKVIIFVHTCKLYEQSRAKVIQETWAKDMDNVIFITDNENPPDNFVYLGPYLKGPTYHPETVKRMFTLYAKNYMHDYPYLMIIDDDSYLFPEKLNNYLSYFDYNEPLLISNFLNWHSGPIDKKSVELWGKQYPRYTYDLWFDGGAGFICSKSACELLIQHYKISEPRLCNHDVWISQLILMHNIPIKRINSVGFHQNPDVVDKYEFNSNMLISVHFAHQMDKLVEFYHKVKAI